MSRTDVLNEIKKAEADAKVTVEKAEADKKASIAAARRESIEKIQVAEANAQKNYDSVIEKETSELAAKREALLEDGRKEAEKLDADLDAKLQKVNDFLKEEFVRAINAAS
jgi:V/A-type H+-transporting ATPase subunit G/H